MSSTPTKVTKTYFLISEEDDLYTKGYYKDSEGKNLKNPTFEQNYDGHPHWVFRFPEQFIHSVNPRSIEVHKVTLITNDANGQNNTLVADILKHSSFIKRDSYLDGTVMICNQLRTKFKKYAYTSADQTFEIWFTSFLQGKDPGKWKAKPNQTKFIIEMMLIY